MTSPIETKLGRHLDAFADTLGWNVQRQVRHGKYTIDFLIDAGTISLIVETDGFNYHDRTVEEAEKDRKRDRFFLFALGIPTVRYLSSEIFKNPLACATNIAQIIGRLDRDKRAHALEHINIGYSAHEEHW